MHTLQVAYTSMTFVMDVEHILNLRQKSIYHQYHITASLFQKLKPSIFEKMIVPYDTQIMLNYPITSYVVRYHQIIQYVHRIRSVDKHFVR